MARFRFTIFGLATLLAFGTQPAMAQDDDNGPARCYRACAVNYADSPGQLEICRAYCRQQYADPDSGGGNGTTPVNPGVCDSGKCTKVD